MAFPLSQALFKETPQEYTACRIAVRTDPVRWEDGDIREIWKICRASEGRLIVSGEATRRGRRKPAEDARDPVEAEAEIIGSTWRGVDRKAAL